MIALLSFTPFQPTPGLAFWSLVIFGLFWLIMGKYAFKPIAKALEKRENDIQHALDSAKKAKEEMVNMKSENEKLLAQAREERTKMLQEAKDMKTQIVNEAKDKAKEEANKIVANAKVDIDNQKKAAIAEVKNQVGNMAVGIAEQILKKELSNKSEQESYVKGLVDKVNLN